MDPETHRKHFNFLRSVPNDILSMAPLVSSLQTFETCLFLIAMDRYPHALVMCAAAIESALKAKLQLEEGDIVSPGDLFNRILQGYGIGKSKRDRFNNLFKRRNSIIHFGFDLETKPIAARMLLETGFPLLSDYYISLFQFYIDYRDIQVSENLSPKDASYSLKNGLHPDLWDEWHLTKEVFSKVSKNHALDVTYCFLPLVMKLRQMTSHMSTFEYEGDGHFDQMQWKKHEERKKQLHNIFNESCWNFDCPVCLGDGVESLVVEIDEDNASKGKIKLRRAECVKCNISVSDPEEKPFLLDVLLKDQLLEKQNKIIEKLK